MFTLLRQEAFKLRKQNHAWWILLIPIIIPLYIIYRHPASYDFSSLALGFNFSTFVFYMVAAVFLSQEFRYGTIRPLLSRSYSRAKVFFSKVIVLFAYYLLMIGTALASTLIAGRLYGHLTITKTMWLALFVNLWTELLIDLFFVALILMATNAAKSGAAAMIVAVFLVLGNVILMAVSRHLIQIWSGFKWNPFALFYCIVESGDSAYANNWPKFANYLHAVTGLTPNVVILVCVFYIFLAYYIAFLIFKRRSV
ncbi:ABC transporter permease [Eupransor demetentiae]|uniref:Permease component (NosY) n=1 Tax=Eupransor demetentiae TaxID=3109584 RepID=A0ABP0EUD0_9LACO|nr:ABC-type transport system involved in multi-copper enzyme maturation [Lactobacillaceae bacterium LMG 33000]